MSRTSHTFTPARGGDVVFRSTDNFLFYIHKRNLEFSTGGFPLADLTSSSGNIDHSQSDVVPLTETSSVLEILFQFVYPQRHPSLDDMNWATFSAVAEAAEKYEVYNAMNVCQIRMRDYIPQHAAEIFGFAAKHDYPNVIALVAPLLVGKPLDEVAEVLPYYMYVPWSIYQQHWVKACMFTLGRAFAFRPCTSHTDILHRTTCAMQQILQDDPRRIAKFGQLLNDIGEMDGLGRMSEINCSRCNMARHVGDWIEEVEREVVKIPDFLSFLKRYKHAGEI